MAGSEASITANKTGEAILLAELPNGRFGKESRENAWVDAQSVLGSAVTIGGEKRGFSDSPESQHLQQLCVPCAPGC